MPGSSWFQPGLDLNVLISLFLIVILPFLLGQMFSVSPGLIAALIAATLIIEYSAPAAGLAAGLPSVYTGITVILVACGVIYVQYSIFDTLSCRSERVKGFLEWIRRKYGGSRVIQHYGVLALVPGMLTVGFY